MNPSQIFFLPGASGNTEFWKPLSNLLACKAERTHFGWPGFGSTPPDKNIKSLYDLSETVVSQIKRPTAIVAQSMGGIIAILAAISKPDLVTHLVLTVTSGGIHYPYPETYNWRNDFKINFPDVPEWFTEFNDDLSEEIKQITAPSLLLWGDTDPISPVEMGKMLSMLLPNSTLKIIKGGDHDLGNTFADDIAPLIDKLFLIH